MNKRAILVIAVILIVLVIAGVIFISIQNNKTESSTNEQNNNLTQSYNTETTIKESTKILVAYYSNSGNTEAMAKEIQNQTGADIFEITRESEYSNMYEEAKAEIDNNERPEVANMPENLDEYDIIFIGYPIWWDTTPAMINTFLENYYLSNKTIIPFCTHGGSGISGTPNTIANKLPNSTVITNGFSLSRTRMEIAPTEVESWLKEINVIN